MRSYDVIVVGLGVMGLATCAALARRGQRVLGIEQFGLPHTMGSSHGGTRIFRTAYFEHADYVPLLKRAHALWHELERRAGAPLLIETGGLFVGPADSPLVRGSTESARAHGIPIDTLDRGDLFRRYPQFDVPPQSVAVFERTAGMLMAERSLIAFANDALAEGAELRTFEKVHSWERSGGAWRVATGAGSSLAGRLVFCGGAWSGRLLADLGLPLRVTRQVSAWLWPSRSSEFAPDRFPIWAYESIDGSFHYGFPLHADAPGMKVAAHEPGPSFDPEIPDRRATPADAAPLVERIGAILPATVGGALTNLQLCMYTMTPDGHFVIDAHPRQEGVYLACGFSGHGFKFAPVVGEALADLAIDGTTQHPIDFLSLRRFATDGHRM